MTADPRVESLTRVVEASSWLRVPYPTAIDFILAIDVSPDLVLVTREEWAAIEARAALGQAWVRAEAAASARGLHVDYIAQHSTESRWAVWAHGPWRAHPDPRKSAYDAEAWAEGPTPTAALIALAEQLEARRP